MATTSRTKDSALGKEKRRGTSPSNSLTSNQRCSSRSSIIDKEKSSQTEKHIPNYLKPTISSRPEPLKLLKKNSPEDDRKILRRRSFDKPPSSSPRGQKALISPARRDRSTGTPPAPVVPRERKLTVRSSSFSGKTVVLPKPVLDNRASKTPKAVKSQPVFSKTAKKGTTYNSLNRKECNASTPSKASSHDSLETVDHETKQEEKEIVEVKSEPEVNSYVTKSENGEEVVDADEDVINNGGEVEKMNNPSDISTCSENQNVLQVGQNEETDKRKTDTQREESSQNLLEEESCDGTSEEIVVEEVKAKTLAHEVEEKGEDQKNENEETGDEKKIEEKDQQGEEEAGKAKEGQELEGDGEEAKQDRESANAESKIQGGKKESPTGYNDVIEETASKLLEKRKNKVKALVGAFETVIDYQSGGSK